MVVSPAKRTLGHVTLVTSAAVVSRLALLAVLVAAGSADVSHVEFQLIAFALAASSAVQVIVDPNTAAAFTVVAWERCERAGFSVWRGVLRLQLAAAVLTVGALTLIVGAVADSREGVLVGMALGTTAMAENVARFARCSFQRRGQFASYAAVDATLGVCRLVGAGALLIGGIDVFLALQPLTLLVGLGWVVACSRALARAGTLPPSPAGVTLRDMWPFSAGGGVSALYSQLPTIFVGAVGGLSAGAIYGVATRITQPSEVLPAAFSSVRLPELVSAPSRQRDALVRTQVRVAATAGALIALVIVATSPFLAHHLARGAQDADVVIATLALALPFKFVNYQLVAVAVASGNAKARLLAASRVAVVSICLTLPAAALDVRLVPCVVIACEVFLYAQLRTLQRRIARLPVHSPVVEV